MVISMATKKYLRLLKQYKDLAPAFHAIAKERHQLKRQMIDLLVPIEKKK